MTVYELIDSGTSKGLFFSVPAAIKAAKEVFARYKELVPVTGGEPITANHLHFSRCSDEIRNRQMGFTVPRGVPFARYSKNGYFIVVAREVMS